MQWLSAAGMIDFIVTNYGEWFDEYMKDKKSEESGHAVLQRLCQRFANRYEFIYVFVLLNKSAS